MPSPPTFESAPAPSSPPAQPLKLTPLTSLELRLRQLEFLVSGSVSSASANVSSVGPGSSTANILRRVIEVQNELERAVEGKSSLERFLDTCECRFWAAWSFVDLPEAMSPQAGADELAPLPPLPLLPARLRSDPANLPLLAPKFSLSHLGLSSEDDVDSVSLETKLALVLEGETDIVDVLQGLEEVDRLDKTGALGAGKLDCEFLHRC